MGFSDKQLEGPFETWQHRHSFVSNKNGETVVYDEIDYELGHGIFHALISRFMSLTLPILFSFRAWRTTRDLDVDELNHAGD